MAKKTPSKAPKAGKAAGRTQKQKAGAGPKIAALSASASKLGTEEPLEKPAFARAGFGMPKRMCPYCGSTDLFSDITAGSIISWTCRSCGNTFPAAIEVGAEDDEDKLD